MPRVRLGAGIATGNIRGVSMSAMPGPTQSELYAGLLPVEPSDEPPPVRPTVLENDLPMQPSLRKRASRTLSRFLTTFCLGVAAALAWQSYGDAYREMIVNSYPQLGWLAPQAKPSDRITLALSPAPSFDPQQLNAMSQDLEAVRQSIDRIAASVTTDHEQMTRNIDRIATGISSTQEQMMHSIDQLAAGQERVALEITKLQAVEQYILYKNSEPPPRTDPAPGPKRVPWPSQASTAH
jgi:hypothetical protein